PAERAALLRAAGIQPVQARKRHVHLRTRPPPRWHRRHRHRSAPRRGTPAHDAATSIYLASAAEVEGVTGQYFTDRRPKTSNKTSYDTAAAARLWDTSARLVHSGRKHKPLAVP